MSVAIFHRIAKQVGVSPRTVQRILNAPLKDTRPAIVKRAQRIRELAEQMNYRPNVAARATASGRFGCISLVRSLGIERSRYTGPMSDAILDELAKHDMHLALHRLPDEKLIEGGFLPKMLRESMSDGLLINYTHHIPTQMLQAIQRHAIPTVWLNVKHPGDCVYPDDVAAGRMATEHLIARGHRKIGYLRLGGSGHYSESDRLQGYLSIMKSAGLTPQVHEVACEKITEPLHPLEPLADPRLDLVLQWLDTPHRPEAVVTYSGWTAQPLVTAALSRGLRPGKDLAIATIEDSVVADGGIVVTTVVLDMAEAGRRAVNMVLEKIETPATLPPVIVANRLVRGQTS